MELAKEELHSADTQASVQEEAEPTPGAHSTPGTETPPRSGSVHYDSPMIWKDEAAGDSSSIDDLYQDPSDSYTGGLFPGSASFDWSSPDSSGEGRNHEGGQENCEERASRPGNSRIPGKDHRRYYHSHWRLEYLMDFNARSHSMICMVCGSSLATLKLSTIKRHIQQKHPYSLNWTPCEKEVIIGGWDAHLCVDAQTLTGGEEQGADGTAVSPGPKKKRRRLPLVAKGSWRSVLGSELNLPPPPDRSQIEQYMNESYKRWLRLEFLMDYDCQGDKLYCMMCSTSLPSLSINDIKNHILDNHPSSIYFHPAQKGFIVESWINRKETPEEIVHVKDEMDEDEDKDVEDDMAKNDSKEDCDQADGKITEQSFQKYVGKKSVNGEAKEKGEQKNVEVWEKDDLKPSKAQHLKKSKLKARNVISLEEEKTREENHLEEERIIEEAYLNDDLKAKVAKKLEEQWTTREATLLKEQEKAREAQLQEKEQQKSTELKLLEEKHNARETKLEKEQRKTKEAQMSEGENHKGREAQLKEEYLAIETPLLANEETGKEVKTLEEEQCKAKDAQLEEQSKSTETLLKEKAVQTLSREQQCEQENIVRIESQKTVEPFMMLKGQVLNSVVETAIRNMKKEQEKQSCPKLVEEGTKWSIIPEKQIIQVQQVPQVQQTPAVLGIGVPLLKMETPTPIIITRVSVLPEHTVVTPPKPSTSSDASKSYRVIAPKGTEELQNQKLCGITESSQLPAGVLSLWEVCLWQDNSCTSMSTFQCNAYQLRWRLDYMMDYNGLRGSVVCMYCCSSLTVLKESSIRRHIAQKHPHTSHFSAEQKAAIIVDWENKLSEVRKLVAKQNKEGVIIDPGLTSFKVSECDAVEEEEQETNWAATLSEGKGASWEFVFGRGQGSAPKDPGKYQHDRWKLEFLMDYTPNKDGLICMVCGVTLINPKISTVKMHIQQKHPDTIYLSDQEKAVVIEEWEQRLSAGKQGSSHQTGDDEICIEIKEDATASETHGSSAASCAPRTEIILPTISKPSKPAAALPPPCNTAKRSYKDRWRTEFMMDYDCRRQGLICMVCGGTLATLKVSTIKRHIVQVHPYSVDFTPEERQRILEAYSEMALHYIHSEECFKAQPQEKATGRKRKAAAIEEHVEPLNYT
ncbi:zinc finger translocation-associated protein [Mantella aurantiaca]